MGAQNSTVEEVNGEYLYHYTNKEGAQLITKSEKIKASSIGAYGPGVYLTSLPPDRSNYRIISNNWDDGQAVCIDPDNIAKIEFCFSFPKSSIREATKKESRDGGRDVWVYPADLTLREKAGSIFIRK